MAGSKPAEKLVELEGNSRLVQEREGRFRSALWTVIFLLVVGFFGYYYAVGRVDQKLTGEILKKLQIEFPKHIISLDRASLQPGKSILLEGIRICRPTERGARPVFECSRIVCKGPIDWVSLAQGQLVVDEVIVDGVEISVWPIHDGRWSVQELSSNKPIPETFPKIDIRSGLVRFGGATQNSDQEIVCHDLRAKLGLMPRVVDQQIMPLVLDIDASISSSYFQKLKLRARTNQNKDNWTAFGSLERFEYSPRLATKLPLPLQKHLTSLDGLSGELSLQFEGGQQNGAISYSIHGDAQKGRWHHPQIPFPLEAIAGKVFCKNGSLQVRDLTARSANASIQADLDWNGMTLKSPARAIVKVQKLDLDQRLYQSIPASIQDIWKRLRPSGTLNAVADIAFDGEKWDPKVQVEACDASISADYFPYPVQQIHGNFVYESGSIRAPDLVGLAGGQRVTAKLELTKAQPRWLMDFSIFADGPISIDENLITALTPRGSEPGGFQNFLKTLHPQGTVHLKSGYFRRTEEHPDTISKSIELTFSECAIKYDQFKYPIVDIHGEATLDNQRLVLRDFTGRNDGARIKAFGYCQGEDAGLDSIDLEFNAFDVALDEELQSSLPPSVRSLWDQLQPTGSMDHVQVTMRKSDLNEPLDLRVEMNESRDANDRVGRTVAFRPTAIPYSIHDVACCIKYRPGRIDIVSLSGVHDASRLLASGHCRLHNDSTWDGTIDWLDTTRFIVDQNLLKCLPDYLRDPLMRLDFRGPINVTGSTQIASPQNEWDSIVRSWELELQIEDGRLGGGGIASGMRGAIAMNGFNSNEGPLAFGTVDFDALAVKGIAVTGATGPFALTRSELYFGRDAVTWQERMNLKANRKSPSDSAAEDSIATAYFQTDGGRNDSSIHPAGAIRDRMQNRIDAKFASMAKDTTTTSPPLSMEFPPLSDVPPMDLSENDVRARTLSGTLFLSGVEPLDGKRARYKLRLVDSHLKECLLDLGEPNVDANGRLSVQCDVQGSITNLTSIEGNGNAWLRGAKLYQLPVMIRLFRLLSVRPDQGAFDSADVRFSIDGERFPIHELQLEGDLMTLRGSGWVNVRRELQLDLHANVSKRTLVGAMMRPIAPNNSANLFRIEVSGTASDPQMRRTVPLMNSWEPVLPESR